MRNWTTTRWSQDLTSRSLPLFLITVPRSDKSLEVFKLTSLCYISIKVEAYKSQAGLAQCHNCQQFGHVWANCKQPPSCRWCGGGYLNRDCPEKGKKTQHGVVAIVSWQKGNYRGCSHAQRSGPRATKPNNARAFSNYITSGMFFAQALQDKAGQTPPSSGSSSHRGPAKTSESNFRIQRNGWKQVSQFRLQV
jgi:hypothetical protein